LRLINDAIGAGLSIGGARYSKDGRRKGSFDLLALLPDVTDFALRPATSTSSLAQVTEEPVLGE